MESNVTVIIPAIKNSDILKHTIAKCLDLKCKVKLIVVTDDNTNRHFENDSRVEYIIVNPGLNMSTKRNLAVKNTDSEYIVFFDSDSYPENSETIKAFKLCLQYSTYKSGIKIKILIYEKYIKTVFNMQPAYMVILFSSTR